MSLTQFAHSPGARLVPFPTYTGQRAPGVCKSCGCASADCCCGCRQCRTEAKELTLTASAKEGRQGAIGSLVAAHMTHVDSNPQAAAGAPATATAFVGGGCCVHISLEYAPITPTAQSIVGILVRDTEGTIMAWEKIDPPGTHYQVKQNVVTTRPGATLTLLAVNATVRARWCEVFSC